ncbi:MAG: DUF4197 domain-containing protein [Bacteroidia bacterium]|nr:DUF4197 domain-containing protein [Bacteroidia bacterium]
MRTLRIFSLLLLTSASFLVVSCEKIDTILQTVGLSNEEVILGLKTALNVGSDTSVTVLSKVDGYYKDELVKILLPDEAQPVYDVVNKIPGGSLLIDNAVLAINRAAEDAAPQAKPIFVNAITGITIADGFSILNGGDTAATIYLKGKTYDSLTMAFSPKINASLSKPVLGSVSAASAYKDLVDAYNTASLGGILFPQITTNTLGEHVTKKALDGLYYKVSEEERKIRKDPLHRVSEILQKVFGAK